MTTRPPSPPSRAARALTVQHFAAPAVAGLVFAVLSWFAPAAVLAAPSGGGPAPPQAASNVTPERVAAAVEGAAAALRAAEPGDPIPAAAEDLWALGRLDPASEAGQRATRETLRLLVGHGHGAAAAAKAAQMGPAEPAWEPLLDGLLTAGRSSRDYGPFRAAVAVRLGQLEERSEERARYLFVLGRIDLSEGRRDDGLEAFRKAAAAAPDSAIAGEARKMLAQLQKLAPGRQAPAFSGTTFEGRPLSLEKLRGETVLVAVWASW